MIHRDALLNPHYFLKRYGEIMRDFAKYDTYGVLPKLQYVDLDKEKEATNFNKKPIEEKRLILKELSLCETIFSILDDMYRVGMLKKEKPNATRKNGH